MTELRVARAPDLRAMVAAISFLQSRSFDFRNMRLTESYESFVNTISAYQISPCSVTPNIYSTRSLLSIIILDTLY
jgi:hypothetical protein